MGAYYFGIPEDLALFFYKNHNAKYFVETGTYMGGTAYWASNIFKNVVTIEIVEEIYNKTKEAYKNVANIRFMNGKSTIILPEIITQLNQELLDDERILFWLDAHYSGGVTGGENLQCPLIEEINLILKLNFNSIIMIDDARFVLCANPDKNILSDMPSYDVILAALNSHGKRYTIIWRDVVVSVPIDIAESVYRFFQPTVGIQGTMFLDEYIERSKLSIQKIHYKINKKLRAIIKKV
ncbi:hypothetical protein AGMMS49579_20350 [Spirochaetia bacterium]|nr:hypothetical protein AGMMS49579_20350 [Spirochaetia bacterium]